MSAYTRTGHSALAAVLVATFAGLISYGLELDQRLIYERDILANGAGITQAFELPEVVVRASRLGS